MIAHLMMHKGRLAWSGYGASGDPTHTIAAKVDVGRDFLITSEEKLYVIDPGPQQFEQFTPSGLVVAARAGWFGLKLVEENQHAGWSRDREEQRRQKLGRRGRIAEQQNER